ncbi:hypothetical protein B0A49_01862 [Cryomyces minteri]|uniref:Tubulin-folding cofactor D C-terminal domain-containing protein n=1 Tax=Cryomyces minteri TaxID=331657 RepID=A0A4U0XK98_9PEZI|nr:hypothetical protein B0A49_01862 [Cryomyces minteri]
MTEISFSAASLGKIYRNALFDGLFDWRGVGAPDVLSRDAAAEAMGRLSTLEVRFEVVMGMVNRVKQRLKTVADRDVEERHGLMMSLASFIDQANGTIEPNHRRPFRNDEDNDSLETSLKSAYRTALAYTPRPHSESEIITPSADTSSVSTYLYYRSLLQLLAPNVPLCIRRAILEGYISSAGGGSESVVQASRAALADALAANALSARGSTYGLADICHTFVDILRDNLSTDRIVLPLLEVLAFLFDAHIIQRIAEEGTRFRWRTLLSLVQKAHFKSNSIPKLLAAVNVYRGLAEIEVVRGSVLTKLASMLLHPFPKVRAAVADSLYTITEDGALKPHDWSSDVKALKPVAEAFGKRHLE